MPFFGLKQRLTQKNNDPPLQAIRFPEYTYDREHNLRKRVWISASCYEDEMKDSRGSMTVEAALVLSMFLFAMVLLMIPIKIMNTERRMQEALEAVGEDMAQYAYLEMLGEKTEYFALAEAGAAVYGAAKVRDMVDTEQIKNISLLRSSILEDGYTIDLTADYEIRLPFPIFRIGGLKRQLRCCRRAWVGMEGGKRSEQEGITEDKEIVYIGKGSERYHRNRFCHYLFNDISRVDFERIDSMRNSQGKKYRPCSICGKNIAGGSVYIMPSGESYHSRTDCRAITAYVEAVPLKSVEHMGPCSYCSFNS